jgi:voltage-gated potassium channel
MKFLPTQIYYFLRQRPGRRNVMNLFRFLLVLAGVVTVYSILFHYIMEWEGREYSWVSGFYWTLTVMSTLGFGDITFNSDLGRVFSMAVLLSGIIFLLVLLPFTFMEFFYAPWLRSLKEAQAPNRLPETTRDHVILTRLDAVTDALIDRLERYHYRYILLVPELEEALRLHEMGYQVVRGALDDPATYRRIQTQNAVLVVSTASDQVNSNVAFTVREISAEVPIITTANFSASVDILELAGSNQVLQLGEIMGQALARRVIGNDNVAHIIGQFGTLLIAEAVVGDSELTGQTLAESRFRDKTGVSVVGIWQRGRFEVARSDTCLAEGNVLVMTGSTADIARYNQLFATAQVVEGPVIIIGGGRVGRATGRWLAARSQDYRIVERLPERVRDPEKYILGNAAEREVLLQAGIKEAPAVVITTHEDDMNIYLTIYCRRLRPDIQIISRATLERNVDTLHRAGADFVLSYASIGANAIISSLSRSNILMLAEGLDVFEIRVPARLAGRTIAEADVRRITGSTIIAVHHNGETLINPPAKTRLPAGAEIVLVGTVEAEQQFLERFGP